MPSFQFLHCADLHIDSPLRGLESDRDAPVERIRGATRAAFTALVDDAIARRVAFVVAAGDLYDGEWQDWRTGQFLIGQVARLSRVGIPFVAIRGNHDAESNLTRHLRLPEPARLLSARRPETVALPELDVCIHGQSFRTREVTENIAAAYPPPMPGRLNIGLLHTSVDGREGHATYAPCTVDQLRNHGYDYWALGHVHTREVLHRDPWIIFPGNPQGRHVRETGAKGATLVTVRDGRITDAEPMVYDTVRWAQVPVDLGGAVTEEDALAQARAALARATEDADGRLLAARVILAGACAAHEILNRDAGATVEKVRAEALAVAGPEALWTESVRLRTTPPTRDVAGSPLLAAIDAVDPAALAQSAVEYCRALIDRASGLRDALGDDHPAIAALRDSTVPPDLLARAKALLLARLSEG